MSDFEKELEAMVAETADEPEVALPSIEEQKAIVAEFKKLEAEGKLTPEVLEAHFGQFNKKNDKPIH
ncbi:restriction endonuclease subunit S [Vibrio maerlii]|uniref:restriction endonuclease subunit S n=1 Tax=Vibrio maerlii TaxID=2231648 RepID=UPI000E3DCE50|nr:restriction endonuclease subunit S [Vibrio maerlii]